MLREEWTGDRGTAVPVATHVLEMRERLAEITQLVSEHATKSQQRQKRYYDIEEQSPADLKLGIRC